MDAIIWLVATICRIYFWILVVHVVVSWLLGLGVIRGHYPVVRWLGSFLFQVTEPVLAPIRRLLRRFLGNLGGIDISPIVAVLVLEFLCRLLIDNVLLPLSHP